MLGLILEVEVAEEVIDICSCAAGSRAISGAVEGSCRHEEVPELLCGGRECEDISGWGAHLVVVQNGVPEGEQVRIAVGQIHIQLQGAEHLGLEPLGICM